VALAIILELPHWGVGLTLERRDGVFSIGWFVPRRFRLSQRNESMLRGTASKLAVLWLFAT